MIGTPQAISYLRRAHGIRLSGQGLRAHVRRGHLGQLPSLSGRYFYTLDVLDSFAATKRGRGRPPRQ